MTTLVEELRLISQDLNTFITKVTKSDVTDPLDALKNSAEAVGHAWSRSWIGYHANVYYEGFNPPPPGDYFSAEWGLMFHNRGASTSPEWKVYDPNDVTCEILQRANEPDITLAQQLADEGQKLFTYKRDQVLSILEVSKSQNNDEFLKALLGQTQQLNLASERDYIVTVTPNSFATRDSAAMHQGLWTPPHIAMSAKVAALYNPIFVNRNLADIAQKAADHIERLARQTVKIQPSDLHGTRVFIGHGGSTLWKDLKDFLHERLNLPWDEFNRVPVAGKTIVERLSEMLDSSSIAFLIMTAEDEQLDGKVRARMNVIHEVGLFQGRLGFAKAIVLMEEGCDEFSNIHGLVQIRFPKGNIEASFERIREILEREQIIKP